MLEAEVDSERNRMKRVLEWKTKFFRYDELLKDYGKKQKKKAPNSYQNNYHYLAHYVLPFFLSEKRKISNVLLWPNHFDDFKEYLEREARLVRTDRPLS